MFFGLRLKVTDAVDFQVSLVGAPSVRIDVSGSDLRLLDASEPWMDGKIYRDGRGI